MNFDITEARSLLAQTPRALSAWLEGLPEGWLDCRDGEDTWTPRQVVAHLVHGERNVWIPRVRHLLAHGPRVPFETFDRHSPLAQQLPPVALLLAEFTAVRADGLRALDELLEQAPSLDARGLHPDLGEVTLRQLLATWVAHDLGHITQIARTMARRYTSDVGPWRQYLSVLGPPAG